MNCLELVVDVNTDDLTRHRMNACIYCGNTTSITRDHVVPVSWGGFKRFYDRNDTVKCCKECNSVLGSKPYFSISSRAHYLASRYQSKYRKLINIPDWSESELSQMSDDFIKSIRSQKLLKNFYVSRISHCVLVSLEDDLQDNIKQQTFDDVKYYRILSALYSGLPLNVIAKSFEICPKELASMFRAKKMSKIVNTFKFERGIPFDYPIYRLFNEVRRHLKQRSKSDN
jgi:hypothetical protein